MPLDYFSSLDEPFNAKLARAWADYQSNERTEAERLKALDFLVYGLDIKTVYYKPNELNRVIHELMLKRDEKKKDDTSDLLVIDEKKKREDKTSCITYLSDKERAEYHLDIRDGLFYQAGHVFDSSRFEAHGKSGYVAFTMSMEGEISAFNHLGGKRNKKEHVLLHSSMNQGAAVLMAGEMEIKHGKLIRINTYSGHYKPTLYEVARFLNYVSDRGMDISKATVLLKEPPSTLSQLKAKEVGVRGDNAFWYELKASDVVTNIKAVMTSNIRSLDVYLKSYTTALYQAIGDVTQDRTSLAQNFKRELEYVVYMMKDTSSLEELNQACDVLESMITWYESENKAIKSGGRLSDKFSEMKQQVHAMKSKVEKADEKTEEIKKNDFKRIW